jgi:hypothetical protein
LDKLDLAIWEKATKGQLVIFERAVDDI